MTGLAETVEQAFDPTLSLLGGRPILAFANDWTADPTSKHHIMKRFSRSTDVFWVEAAGMRAPRLASAYDRGRLLSKARSMLRQSREVLPRLRAFTPPALPYPNSAIARLANSVLYTSTITREMRRVGLDRDPVICSFQPQCAPYIRRIPRAFTIYYCVDKWGAFKDFDPALMARSEEEMCRRADLVIASAEDLAERCRRYADRVEYIPHGVDFEHFASALSPLEEPADLAAIPGPRVGFFGLLHEWVDIDLIGRLADALPYQFVLIGSTSEDLSALQRRPNVHYLGRRPYATLPAYSRGFSTALVPFKMTELTASVNPIKLKEYAAAGLPVVSSPLPEVLKLPHIATCASTFDEWVARVREAVEQGGNPVARKAQSERVRQDDWLSVCERIAQLVNETGVRS